MINGLKEVCEALWHEDMIRAESKGGNIDRNKSDFFCHILDIYFYMWYNIFNGDR